MPGIITKEKINILKQKLTIILSKALRDHGLYDKIWQAYAALLPVKTVGVMGDNQNLRILVFVKSHYIRGWNDCRFL